MAEPKSDSDLLLSVIRGRRSIRRFTGEPLPAGAEQQLLEAMVWAPTGGNAQPWHFVRVKSPELRRELAAAALNQRFIAEAPLVMVICVDVPRAERAYGARGVSLYCLQDTAAATQNLLLMAHALGLGSCWVGAFDERRVARVLQLGAALRPVALVPMGVPAQQPRAPGRRPVTEISEER